MTYQLKCDDPKLNKLYERHLRERPQDADTGFNALDVKTDYEQQLVGKGDLSISCEEIAEYFFRNYKDYSDVIKDLTGRPVSWKITDKKVIERIETVTSLVKDTLKENGLVEGTPQYKERLAIGLYFFAFAPRKGDLQSEHFVWHNIRSNLNRSGLEKLASFLDVNGGLGLSLMKDPPSLEYSADEALQLYRGECTEKSKILFDIFDRAGLDPFFVISANSIAINNKWDEYWNKKVPFIGTLMEAQTTGHAFIGIKIGDTPRYFDANIAVAVGDNAPFAGAAWHVSNREFHIIEEHNRLLSIKDNAVIENMLDGIAIFGRSSLDTTIKKTRSRHLANTGDLWGAIEMLLKEVNNGNPDPKVAMQLGRFYISAGDLDNGLKYLKISAKKDPDNIEMLIMMAALYGNIGRFKDGERLLERAHRLDRANWKITLNLGLFKLYIGDRAGGIEHMAEYLKENPSDLMVNAELVRQLMLAGRYKEAIGHAVKGATGKHEPPKDNVLLIKLEDLKDKYALEAYLRLAECNYRLGNKKDMKFWAELAYARSDSEPASILWKAKSLSNEGKWKEAANLILNAEKNDPTVLADHRLYFCLCEALWYSGKKNEAYERLDLYTRVFETMLASNERFDNIRKLEFYRACCSEKFLKDKKVASYLANMYMNASVKLDTVNNWELQMAVSKALIELAPDFAPAYIRLIRSSEKLGLKIDKASILKRYIETGRGYYEKNLESYTKKTSTLIECANYYEMAGDKERARELFTALAEAIRETIDASLESSNHIEAYSVISYAYALWKSGSAPELAEEYFDVARRASYNVTTHSAAERVFEVSTMFSLLPEDLTQNEWVKDNSASLYDSICTQIFDAGHYHMAKECFADLFAFSGSDRHKERSEEADRKWKEEEGPLIR